MSKTFCGLLLTLCICFSAQAQHKSLSFAADGQFKIVQFTDVHFQPGNPHSQVAIERMHEVLDAERPNLVVYTGDLIFAAPAKEALLAVLSPALQRQLPFAVVFGNHDDEFGLDRSELLEVTQGLPGNYTATTPGLSGVTNFILPLEGVKEPGIQAVLYFFDSHAYSPLKDVSGYDWLKMDQIQWYLQNSRAFTQQHQNTPLPSLAFFHIPLPEYAQAASSENAKLVGSRMEKACAPTLNTGMFTAMLEAGDIMACFVGHDHNNNYAVLWHQILLCYGQFTGGDTVYNDLPEKNGARVIILEEGRHGFSTYIRLKDEKIIHPLQYPESFQKNVIPQ
jgi:Predicted phosphohydrolases